MNKFQKIGSDGLSVHDMTEHLFERDSESFGILFYKEQCEVLTEDVLAKYANVHGAVGMKHLEYSVLSFMADCIGAHPSESPSLYSKKPERPLSPYDFEAINRLLTDIRCIGEKLCLMADSILKIPAKH